MCTKWLMKDGPTLIVPWRLCSVAEKDHRRNQRFYAHTFHYKDTICLAKAFWDLPQDHRDGIILHEIGHLVVGEKGAENDANRAVQTFLGANIEYVDSPYGRNLERLNMKKGHFKITKTNPRGSRGKFARCVEAVSARGGAYDPRAVCAVQERREIGQKELTRRAVAGKRKARKSASGGARGNPAQYIIERKDASGWFPEAFSPASSMHEALEAVRYLMPGDRVRVVKHDTESGKSKVMRTLTVPRHNPADAAAEAYHIFHGEPPSRFTEVIERRHHHGFLFSVGRLEYLIVRTIDRSSEVKLKKFAGAFLAGNEQAFKELSETGHARAQLYIKDGDQSINLEDFGIDPQRAHEIETLGRVIDVGYETNKVHLGSEGGQAIYDHKFRRTREGDVEITVDWARYPDLIYYVLDQRLEFSGGSYELIAEGINL